MFRAFAVPEIVGLATLGFGAALCSAIFFAVSVNIFTSSSRVSGFFVSVPDILSHVSHQMWLLVYKSVGMAAPIGCFAAFLGFELSAMRFLSGAGLHYCEGY